MNTALSSPRHLLPPALAILLVLLSPLTVQDTAAQNLVWASRAGGAGGDYGYGTAADAFGNVYYVGVVQGTATFGAGTPNETILTGDGNSAYLAKYTAGGLFRWVVQGAKHPTGIGAVRALDVATDAAGNVYATGFYRGNVTFGAGGPNETDLSSLYPDTTVSIYLNHGFIAKYDPDGVLAWAVDVSIPSLATFEANGITVAPDGSLYVTGMYIDGQRATDDAHDAFMARYASDGTQLWLHRLGQRGDGLTSEGHEVDTDPAGLVYVTGECSGTYTLGTPSGGLGPACDGSFMARFSPAGTLQWARTAPGFAYSLAVDGSAGFYTTGSFVGTITFGSGEANQTTLTASGHRDLFLARYGADGSLVWVRRAGGTYHTFEAQGRSVAVAPGGNVYLMGHFYNTIVFAAGEANQIQLTTEGFSDIFLSKYNPDGQFLWATKDGGSGLDEGEDVAVDAVGRVFVTGRFSEMVSFGFSYETTLASAGSSDIFMARVVGSPLEGGKSDQAPNLVWANQTTSGEQSGNQFSSQASVPLFVDAAGNSYVTGLYDGEVTFGAGEAGETTLVGGSERIDHFLAKYNAQGEVRWVKSVESTSSSEINGIAVDAQGTTVVTGAYGPSITFGKGEANETTLESNTNEDFFIASFQSDGSFAWARTSVSDEIGNARGFAVDVDGWGNGYVTGWFAGTITFGQGEAGETTLTTDGDADLFLAKYRPDGTLAWVTRATSSHSEWGSGIAVDALGRIFVTGTLSAAGTTFGPGEPNETQVAGRMFVARYRPDGTLVWVKRVIDDPGSDNDRHIESRDVALDASGNAYVTGIFYGEATFGPGESNETTLTKDVYGGELFVARYTLGGSFDWARQTRGYGLNGGNAIAVDPSGNTLVTGFMSGAITLGLGEAQETTLFSEDEDVLVAKFNADGALVWARRDGGSGAVRGYGLGIDAQNNVYVMGWFRQKTVFGLDEPNETMLVSSAPISELFIAKYEGDQLGSKVSAPQETPAITPADAADADRPARFALDANYPNPFNPTTTIRFHLDAADTPVRLEVYDVTGRRVRTLVAGSLPAGAHAVVWDGRDEGGRAVSSGVYAYRLQAGARSLTRTMALIK